MGNSICFCRNKDSQDVCLLPGRLEAGSHEENAQSLKASAMGSRLINSKSDLDKLCYVQRHIIRRINIRKARNLSHLIDDNGSDRNETLPGTGSSVRKKNFDVTNYCYNGEYENGMKQGFGIQTWKDGAVYIGYFYLNKAEFIGTFIHSNGEVYKGEFKDNKAYGYGTYAHSNGASYEGEWVNDSQNGIGIETWADLSDYAGQYKNGKKTGYGLYNWADGSSYEGEWVENSLHGLGMYVFPDKRVYLGNWYNNTMRGYGEFYWNDGKKYKGFHSNDKKEGFGIYFWPKLNKIYVGYWSNGKQNGLGRYITQKRSKWGRWKDGEIAEWFESKELAYAHFNITNQKNERYFDMSMEEYLDFLSN